MLKIGMWNVEWKGKRSPATTRIKQILRHYDFDILCINEGYPHHLPDWIDGHKIHSEHSGVARYENKMGRKVYLWSKTAFNSVDTIGHPDLPEGRFVSAKISTGIGEIQVIGLAIPYFMYRVQSHNFKTNEGKIRYLNLLKKHILPDYTLEHTIIVGDFNIQIPQQGKQYPPADINRLRQETFKPFLIPSAGDKSHFILEQPLSNTRIAADKMFVDHICHSEDLQTETIWRWSRKTADNVRLSDHDGVGALLTLR